MYNIARHHNNYEMTKSNTHTLQRLIQAPKYHAECLHANLRSLGKHP
jgi:hypothetical protein